MQLGSLVTELPSPGLKTNLYKLDEFIISGEMLLHDFGLNPSIFFTHSLMENFIPNFEIYKYILSQNFALNS
jgi:hypothetical protein